MSANDSASGARPANSARRAVRVRNRCLEILAARRSLPRPTADELSALDDDTGLGVALERWEKLHTPPVGVAEVPPVKVESPPNRRTRWRSPGVLKSTAVVTAGLLGVVAGDFWRQRASAQQQTAVAEQRWMPVNDSVVAAINATFVSTATNEARPSVQLSAADIATLIVRSPRRRSVPIDSAEARIDSLLWIRGRLRRGPRFELGGEVSMLRRGLAELRVTRLVVDGQPADSARVSRLVAGPRARSSDVDRLRFDVPLWVSSILIAGRSAVLEGGGTQRN